MNLFAQKNNRSEEEEIASHLFQELFPIHRSIAGPGLRDSLKILKKYVELDLIEIPSGKECNGWKVPKEWEIKEAWIKDKEGNEIVNYKNSNLHVVSFSKRISKILKGKLLKEKIHSLPSLPSAIPYRTSYYKADWGFCMPNTTLNKIKDDHEYEVLIDSTHFKGSMSLGIAALKSDNPKAPSYLISTYICHPSLANDNLSGPIMSVLLWNRLKSLKSRSCNWFLEISPETIGSLAWLDKFPLIAKKLEGVFVNTTCAGPGKIGYKDSFEKNSQISRAVRLAFRDLKIEPIKYPFVPDGSDERQFSSPGYRIPCVSIVKNKYYEYKEYHNSLDNLNYTSPVNLLESTDITWQSILNLEADCKYKRFKMKGETQLGPHGLYPTLSGHVNSSDIDKQLEAFAWLDWFGDGKLNLLEISEQVNISVQELYAALQKLIHAEIGSICK